MSDFPMPLGDDRYELSDGSEVEGHEEAKAAQAVIDAEERRDRQIIERGFRGRTKYVCGVCERFHNVGNPAPVEDHIEQHH